MLRKPACASCRPVFNYCHISIYCTANLQTPYRSELIVDMLAEL